MGEQIIRHQLPQVASGVLSLANRMSAVGVRHHRELFVVRDQFINQDFGGLIMTVVVTSAVNQQQVALQLVCKVDR